MFDCDAPSLSIAGSEDASAGAEGVILLMTILGRFFFCVAADGACVYCVAIGGSGITDGYSGILGMAPWLAFASAIFLEVLTFGYS